MIEYTKHFAEATAADPLDSSTKLNKFSLECEAKQNEPLAGDERVAAFAQAAQYSLEVNPQFRDGLLEVFDQRPQEPVEYTFSRMLRAFQKALISEEAQEVFEYPEAFDEPNWQNWCVAFDWVLNHPHHSDQFAYDMWTRELQSNITERYKNIKLLQLLMPGILPPQSSILDVGCSQNQGLKKLALDRPFAHTPVMREIARLGDSDIYGKTEYEIDDRGTKLVNKLLASTIHLGPSVGVDIEPIYDPWVKEWTEACTFLPTERLNEKLRTEYNLIDKKDVPGVGFVEADFLKLNNAPDKIEQIRRLGRQGFNAIFLSTIVYQQTEADRKIMLDNGDGFKYPGGIKVILDNAKKDPNAPSGLSFNPDYSTDYGYTTHIDHPDGSGELLEVFKWKNGRCLQLKAGDDIDRLATIPGVNTDLLDAISLRD